MAIRLNNKNVKLKVLHILVDGKYSGAQHVALSIIENTMDCCDSLYVSKKGKVKDALDENNINYLFLNKISVQSIRRAVRSYRPDIIHAHDFTASLIGLIAAGHIPVISHIHQNPPWLKHINYKSFMFMLISVGAKKILTVSDSIVEECVFKNFLIKKNRVIGNPINISSIIEKSLEHEVVTEESCAYDLAFVGRLESEKNPLAFVKIVDDIKVLVKNVTAVMIGEGTEYLKCKNLIKELDLKDNIKLLGYLSNPYSVLRKCKVVCIPSKWEGFGLTAVEGLALGKPVVCSDVGGLKKIINDKVGKKCNTKEEYREEVSRLLLDQEYYNEKSNNAISYAKTFDNIKEYRDNIVEIYTNCLQKRK